jgi:hypothetical protein
LTLKIIKKPVSWNKIITLNSMAIVLFNYFFKNIDYKLNQKKEILLVVLQKFINHIFATNDNRRSLV